MSSLPVAGTSASISQDYMKLLVTQLQNQNPLEPMDNNQMSAQMTQLAQLQQLETMNGSFAQVLAGQQAGQAASLLGKQVTFKPADSEQTYIGQVQGVDLTGGNIKLKVGTYTVEMSQVLTITN